MKKRFNMAVLCGAALMAMVATVAAMTEPATAQELVQPNWDSIEKNYKVPDWFVDGKFGIFMHWGLYAVPARTNEWYVQKMYSNGSVMQWQIEKYGPLDKFGYKDFIPMFTCEKFNPDEWAELFKKAGARYVIPTAEHHDGWANWDSDLTKWCAGKMGPKRDLIGELAEAVRRQGMKFGVSNHRMEHYSFIRPPRDVETDLYDPEYADFYWVADHSDELYQKFLVDWVARNFELIDKYKVDMLWFDNGVNSRNLDPVKLKVAAYYYNRAAEWGKEVSLSTKRDAYLFGSIKDYERGRAVDISPNPWQEDTSIAHNTWGYMTDIVYRNPGEMVREMVDCVSKNGNYLLNLAPKADGTIPEEQRLRLLQIGAWLEMNGEAVFETRPWIVYGEGPTKTEPRGDRGLVDGMLKVYSSKDIRFTTKGDILYAFLFAWPPDNQALITSLAAGRAPEGNIETVQMLGSKDMLKFSRDSNGLKVQLPVWKPCEYAYTLKITGLKLK